MDSSREDDREKRRGLFAGGQPSWRFILGLLAFSLALWWLPSLFERNQEFFEGLDRFDEKNWSAAVTHLEKARQAETLAPRNLQTCNYALALSYIQLQRYEEALDAAYRSRQLAEIIGDLDAFPILIMARALSYRHVETKEDRLKVHAEKELTLFIKEALEDGMPTQQISVHAQATQHRLKTGEMITEEEYIRQNYPSAK